MNPRNFFAELKRRNVYKVAVAYAIVGWLVIQVSATVLPTFHAPEWIVQTLVVLVVLGFPIALVIAWAFEMTPEGMRRTQNFSPDAELPHGNRQKLAPLIVAIGAIAAGLLAFQFLRRSPAPSTTATAVDKSVAVLPFENFNRDPENAYFADGIQDEILTRLAKIDELKVISRTSTQRYKASPENLPVIAKQLGVAHVLEGSVQKAGDQVRVTVQLIRAATDSHVWAETYDRKLTDIFAVESEIAEKIAKSLRAKLTPGEQRAVAAKPTDNTEAYDAYLRGVALWASLDISTDALQRMAANFSRAVELDPNFAVAWANLSVIHSLSYAEFDPTARRSADAKHALDTAMKLQPALGDGYFALGLYRYRVLRDYDGALEAFGQAIDRGVNKAMSLEFIGYVKRRQGKWEETLAMHAESSSLDPRNPIIFTERAVTLRGLRRFAEAHAAVDRALEISAGSPLVLAQKARLCQAEGNFEAAEKLIEHLTLDPQQLELVGTFYNQWISTRRFAEAVRALQELLAKQAPIARHLTATYRARLGAAKRWSGDVEGGRADLMIARDEFEALRQQSDKGEGFLENIVVIDGMLGDAAAVERHALALQRQIENDAFYGAEVQQGIAGARAQLGQANLAIPLLRDLLQKPGSAAVTAATLRADPTWDPIRDDPRFQELLTAKP